MAVARQHFLGREPGWPGPSRVETTLIERGIQFLLHLGEGIMTPEIPFATMMWDLEHRIKPFFPEVSRHGSWQSREARYSQDLRRAALVVVANELGKSYVERFYQVLPERIAMLAHPTPGDALAHTGVTATQTREKYGLPEAFLIYPAQFWPHKNHVGLLEALGLLAEKRGLRPALALSGSDQGNLAFVLEKAKQLGLESQVRYLGFVPRKDLLDLYCAARLLVFPALFGPENIPPLEASALGCPVVCGRYPGAELQLGDAALFADALDAEDLASAIERGLTDSALRQALVEKGRLRARAWTNQHMARALLEQVDRFARIRRLWS